MKRNLRRGALQTGLLVLAFAFSPLWGRGSTDMIQEKYLRDVLQEKLTVANQTKAQNKTEEILIPMPRFKMVDDKILRVPLDRPRMTHPQKVIAILRVLFGAASEGDEHIFAITLDHRLSFINAWRVGEGGGDHVMINEPKLIKDLTANDNAVAWIIAHNHPSGNPEPSDDDLKILDQLTHLANAHLRKPLRDFIILADGSDKYYSHRDECERAHNKHRDQAILDPDCQACHDEVTRGL